MLNNESYIHEYLAWVEHPYLPEDLKSELSQIKNDKSEIKDRFFNSLSFGTGGLRGKIGAGTNRMNILTVARTTKGLVDYLFSSGGNSVCIAYDTRNKSKEFAELAAGIIAASGIHVFFFNNVKPTPMLSFAIRYMNASAGIVITASHNPPIYNGYKVYDSSGCQITNAIADGIISYINKHEFIEPYDFLSIERALGLKHLEFIDYIDDAYYKKVCELAIRNEMLQKHANELKILYTPLHGTGYIPVVKVLQKLGFVDVEIVEEQALPNGDFPTVRVPNPEDPLVFSFSEQKAKYSAPDLIMATDPDCDRIGVVVRNKQGKYVSLNGNEIGVLLCDYIMSSQIELGILDNKASIIKTIVSTDLIKRLANDRKVVVEETLTGFKYIGEKIGEWEKTKKRSFLLGFEESYGYLVGDFVRDKDAVIAAALIAEMALYYKRRTKTLINALEDINREYGFASEKLLSIALDNESGSNIIMCIMNNFRYDYQKIFYNERIIKCFDYGKSKEINFNTKKKRKINLPKSEVLKYVFVDESWVAVRPSGTELKIKFYIESYGASSQASEQRAEAILQLIKEFLKGEIVLFSQNMPI